MSKVRSLKVDNFRAFLGEKTFDFTVLGGENVAKFSMLYAPNGTGKTSIFDAIEWSLTGRIHRLEELKNKKNFDGHILCNTNAESEHFCTEIALEDGNWIKRSNRQVMIKQDYLSGKLEASDPETENMVETYKWDSMILPHDKIDGFIGASTPRDLYKNWSAFIDDDETVSLLDFLTRMKNAAVKEKDGIEEKLRLLDDRIKKASISDETRERLNNQVDIISSLEKVDLNKIVSSTDFDGLDVLRGNLDRELLVQDGILVTGKEMLQKLNQAIADWQKYIKDREESNSIKSSLEKGESLILQLESLEKLKNKLDQLYKKSYPIEQQRDKYSKLIEGGEDAIKEIQLYLTRKRAISELQKVKKEHQSDLDIQIDRREKLENQKNVQKKKFTQREKQVEELKKSIIQFFEMQKEIDQYNELNNHFSKNVIDNNIEKERVHKDIIELNTFLSEFTDDVSEEWVEHSAILRKYEVNIENLIVISKKMKLQMKDISDAEDREKTLRTELDDEGMLINSIKSIIQNRDTNECPVCKTPFDSMEVLTDRIDSILCKQSDYLVEIQKLSESGKRNLKLLLELSKGQRELTKSLVVTKYQNLIEKDKSIDENIDKLNQNQLSNNTKVDELRMEQENFIKRIIKIGITQEDIYDDGIQAISNWESDENEKDQQELQKWDITLKEINERVVGLTKKIKAIQDDIDTYDAMNKSIMKNIEIVTVYGLYTELEMTTEGWDDIQKRFSSEYEKYSRIKHEIDNTLVDIRKIQIKDNQNLKIIRVIYEADKKKLLELLESNRSYNELLESCGYRNIDSDDELKEHKVKIEQDIDKTSRMVILMKELQGNISSHQIDNLISGAIKERNELFTVLEVKKGIEDSIVSDFEYIKERFGKRMTSVFNDNISRDLFAKIEPHKVYKDINIITDVDGDKPALYIKVSDINGKEYYPEWYFSSAQLNVLALCIFLSNALSRLDAPIKTVFIDDPIGHFDDINALAFVDVIRSIIEENDVQIIMSTHDRNIFNLTRMKLSEKFYSTRFIDLTTE